MCLDDASEIRQFLGSEAKAGTRRSATAPKSDSLASMLSAWWWYYDEASKTWRVEDFIEALRENVNCSLCLRTREEAYPQDRPVFDSVVQSFKVRRETADEPAMELSCRVPLFLEIIGKRA